MKKINNKQIWNYIIGIICVIGGIYLIINPINSINNIINIIGMILLITGIIKMISSILNKDEIKYVMPSGMLNIIGGIILIRHPESTINFITTIIGIWFILKTTNELYITINLNKENKKELVIGILKLLLGIIILITPIITIVFTGYILGIILIVIGIIIIIKNYNKKTIYKVKVK